MMFDYNAVINDWCWRKEKNRSAGNIKSTAEKTPSDQISLMFPGPYIPRFDMVNNGTMIKNRMFPGPFVLKF